MKNRVCGSNVHSTTLLIYSLNCQFHRYDKSLSSTWIQKIWHGAALAEPVGQNQWPIYILHHRCVTTSLAEYAWMWKLFWSYFSPI